MNRLLLLVTALLCSTIVLSQRTNLDREHFRTSIVNLPSKPILDSTKRTYSMNTGAITIPGFTKIKSGGSLDVNYKFHGTKTGTVDIKKEKNVC